MKQKAMMRFSTVIGRSQNKKNILDIIKEKEKEETDSDLKISEDLSESESSSGGSKFGKASFVVMDEDKSDEAASDEMA